MTCPDCERYKQSASMWRNKAYELGGTPLPWKPEELLRKEYERGFIDGMQKQMQSSVDKAVNRMAQPEQEPVIDKSAAIRIATSLGWTQQRKPLTDEQIEKIADEYGAGGWICDFARAIEAAHGIKGEA